MSAENNGVLVLVFDVAAWDFQMTIIHVCVKREDKNQ